ncbi:hypothetical protein FDP41_004174 [Naegleria fowleri]|uniref:Uncharacterized protein n=1 Tax=Naegleria fowleri TaxID=5763 RepID=A0A6A5BVB8_NAEFO|nr:uncharacterized protein FDP41_004174 [Naegleria fowleri]KAF0976879.1 hypothetical protein FDP41_004174 [Naegleria fowleri]
MFSRNVIGREEEHNSSSLLKKPKITNQMIIEKLNTLMSPEKRSRIVKKTRSGGENKELIHELDNLVLKDDKPVLAQVDILKKELVEFVSENAKPNTSEIIEHSVQPKTYFSQQEITKIRSIYKNSVFFKNSSAKPENYFLNYNVLVHKSKDQNDLYYIGHQLLKFILTKYFNQHLNLVVEENPEDNKKSLNIINDEITKEFQVQDHLMEYFLNQRQLFYLYSRQNNLYELDPFFKQIDFTSADFIDRTAHERLFKSLIGNIYMNVESFDVMMNHILYPFVVKEFIPSFTELIQNNLSQISTKRPFQKQMSIVEQFEYFHTRHYKSLPTYTSVATVGNDIQMVQVYSNNNQLLSIGYGKDYQTAKEDAARRAILHFC